MFALFVFKLRTEAYTSTLGLLTDWLVCPHNALKNLAKVEKLYYGQFLKGFRQQVTWPTLLGGNDLDHIYLKGYMSIEVSNRQPF